MSTNTSAGAERLNVGKTLLMGTGFMATMIAWTMYNNFVPKILERVLNASPMIEKWNESLSGKLPDWLAGLAAGDADVAGAAAVSLVPLLIGIIMTFDNVFGVIFQPAFGKLSDRCHSRLGKRRPFILIGAPISAVLFFLIPQMEDVLGDGAALLPLMLVIILFVFVMSLWRSPCVALMPDLTPSSLRSQANSYISLMGGIGAALAVGLPMAVSKISGLEETGYTPWVFAIAAVFMVVCSLLLLLTKEQDSRLKGISDNLQAEELRRKLKEEAAEEKRALKAIKLNKDEKRSLIFMLIALFLLFCGTNVVETFFSLFAQHILNLDAAQASSRMMAFVAASAIAAIPAGMCGKKIGRKRTIIIGMATIIATFGGYMLVQKFAEGSSFAENSTWVALFLGGASTMFVNVNTLPLVLEIGGLKKIGTFTGYYYTATFLGQVVTPILFGALESALQTNYLSLFVYSPICIVLSLAMVLFVKHGEANQEELEKAVEKIEQENG
ncbi:MAG: MFS transporter [Clostridium sp.]|jgi:Na+/melibiose symporter-like transporter|nr:MFS transporter [Clostridium sp.]